MKAKLHFNILKDAKTQEELEQKVEEMLCSLVNDAKQLITVRNCKNNEAITSVLDEVNQKYLRIVELHESYKADASNFGTPLYNITMLPDGFKAAAVLLNPQYEYYFNIIDHKKKVDKLQEEQDGDYKNVIPVALIPLKDLKFEDLHKEFLHNAFLLSSYAKVFPLKYLRPLAKRMETIKKWIDQGYIDPSDISVSSSL